MNVGLLGLGYWGMKVRSEYENLLRSGVIDSLHTFDLNRETSLRQASSGSIVEPSVSSLLSHVDAVHICTPNTTHFELARSAVESGVHILVEKPMALDSPSCYKLVELGSAHDVIVQVGHVFRFSSAVRVIKESVASGTLGAIRYIRFQWNQFMGYGNTRGMAAQTEIFWDLLPHPLDILNYITDEWPLLARADAVMSETLPGVPLLCDVHVGLPSGIRVSLTVSYLHAQKSRRVEVVGTEGTLVADVVDGTIETYRNGVRNSSEVARNNTIEAELRNFCDAVRTGKSIGNSAIIGAQTVRSIELIRKEARV